MIIDCHTSLLNHCNERKRRTVKRCCEVNDTTHITLRSNNINYCTEKQVWNKWFGLSKVTRFILCTTEGGYWRKLWIYRWCWYETRVLMDRRGQKLIWHIIFTVCPKPQTLKGIENSKSSTERQTSLLITIRLVTKTVPRTKGEGNSWNKLT